MSEWKEDLHPRGKGGKFGHGSGKEWVGKLDNKMAPTLKGEEAYSSVTPAHKVLGFNIDAVDSYTGGGYDHINDLHRKGPESLPNIARVIVQNRSAALDKMFDSVPPLEHSIEVIRGVSNSDKVFGPVGSHLGKTFTDKGFVSTTTDEKIKKGFSTGVDPAHITIHVPAGTRTFAAASGTTIGDIKEREILLNRGSQFRITKDVVIKSETGRSIRHIGMELVK